MDNIEEAESEDNDDEYFYYDKRLPYFNRLLNNNIKNSMKKSNHVKDVLNEVKEVLLKLKYKGLMNDHFKEEGLNKLVVPPLTRWQYHFQMCESILKIREHMPIICNWAGADNISVSEYGEVEGIAKIFKL